MLYVSRYLDVAELRSNTGEGVLKQVSQILACGSVLDNGTGASREGDSQAGARQDSWHLHRGIEEGARAVSAGHPTFYMFEKNKRQNQ